MFARARCRRRCRRSCRCREQCRFHVPRTPSVSGWTQHRRPLVWRLGLRSPRSCVPWIPGQRNVVVIGPEEQVRRSHARRVVTFVQDVLVIGSHAVAEDPCGAIRAHHYPVAPIDGSIPTSRGPATSTSNMARFWSDYWTILTLTCLQNRTDRGTEVPARSRSAYPDGMALLSLGIADSATCTTFVCNAVARSRHIRRQRSCRLRSPPSLARCLDLRFWHVLMDGAHHPENRSGPTRTIPDRT